MKKHTIIVLLIVFTVVSVFAGCLYLFKIVTPSSCCEPEKLQAELPKEGVSIQEPRPLGGNDAYGDPASKYAVDNTHAYFDGKVISADPQTLEVIKGNLEEMKGYIDYSYARDSQTVYYGGVPLAGVVPAKFRPIENGRGGHSYGTDGQTVYFHSLAIPGVDEETFKILWTTIWEGCIYTYYSKDAKHVYFSDSKSGVSTIVPGADIATFQSLENGFGKDKQGYYEGATYLGPTIDLSKLDCAVG